MLETQREQKDDNAFHLDRKVMRWSDRLPGPWRGIWHFVKGVVGTSILLLVFLPVIGAVLVVNVARAWLVAARRRAAGTPVPTHGGRGFWTRAHLGHIVRMAISELCLGQLLVAKERRGLVWRIRQSLSEVTTVLLYIPYAQHPIALFDELRKVYGGEWFPFGDGVTVASHAHVAAWLSRGDVLKGGQSLGWPSSDAQVGYSGMVPIFLSSAPETADHDIWVKAKRLVISWLSEAWSVSPCGSGPAGTELREQPWLPGLLRLVPRHASGLPEHATVWRAYGEAQFYLLTQGGQLTREERHAYLDLVANPAPFFSNFMNFLVGGAALERKGVASFEAVRAALYRQRYSPALQAVFEEARRIDVTPNEVLRLFTIIFGIAGGPAPPKLAHAVISRLYSDPARMVPLWRKNPRRFLLECSRLDKLVPIVSINTTDRFTVRLPVPDIFDAHHGGTAAAARTIEVTRDLPIRLCYATASYDPAVFPEPYRFDPSRPNLDDLVSWNSPAASAQYHKAPDGASTTASSVCPHSMGREPHVEPQCPVTGSSDSVGDSALLPALPVAFAPRYCAGRDWSLDIIQFLVERFLPAVSSELADDVPARDAGSASVGSATDALMNRPLCGSFDYPAPRYIPHMSIRADNNSDPEVEVRRARTLHDELDSYTRAVLRLMRLAVPRWNAFAPRGIDLSPPTDMDLRGPAAPGKTAVMPDGFRGAHSGSPVNQLLAGSSKRSVEVIFGQVLVPTWDEDLPEGYPLVRRLARQWVNSSFVSTTELRDLYFPFPNMDAARGWRRAQFAAGLPAPRQAFEEIDSEHVMTRLAFAGPACHLMKRLPDAGEAPNSSISLLALKHGPPGAAFVHDVSELHAFQVRAPYERYGAIAYFDAGYRPLGVWWCHGGRYISASCTSPEEQEAWHYAKYVWRASWFAHVTVVDHLIGCHLIVANALTVASRVELPATHPLRIFLKPFTFHTASINFQASRSLVNPRGLFPRIWAFEYQTLEKIAEHVMHTRVHGGAGGWATDHNFPSWRRSTSHPSMRDVDDTVFPLRRDLEEYWAIVRTYVLGFLTLYYKPPKDSRNGHRVSSPSGGEAPAALPLSDAEPELHAFLRALSGSLGVPFAGDWNETVDLLTHAIVTVSAWHKHTGNMVEYVARPDWIGCKLQGRSRETVQTWTQLLALISVAGIKMPSILDDFSHLWPDRQDSRHAGMRQLAATFRAQLYQLDAAILARNLHRQHPLWTMSPQFVDCSVGS